MYPARGANDRLINEVAELFAEKLAPLIAAELGPKMAEAASPKWIDMNEAGRRLGISANAVRSRVARGRLVTKHHGRRIYVSAESVDRLS